MIRLVGAVLLTGGGAALGYGAVRNLKRRVFDLEQIMLGLRVIKRELDWRMAPLPELLQRASKETLGQASDFFRLCSIGAGQLNGRPFRQIWKIGLESVKFRVEEADLNVVEQLGGVLGRYDGEKQSYALEEALKKMEACCDDAVKQRNRLGKVYGMLGLTAGTFLMILLL